MNILLVGGLNVNPERFLPLIAKHNVFGIWESTPKWGVSVKAGGPYKEIKEITVKEIAHRKIDIVWSLLSPWDGLTVTNEILKKYPNIPVIRQTQGASTPWWHTPNEAHPRAPYGNYDFDKLKNVLERCAGLMFVSERYRQSLIDQGAEIEHVPYVISNGMAYNNNINCYVDCARTPYKLRTSDSQPHVALIGRIKHPMDALVNHKIHMHCHTTSRVPHGKYVHREPYYGDIGLIKDKPVNISKILKVKQKFWPTVFTKYDAGLMHFFNPDGADVFNGIDINVPGRVNTYIMHGLPPIIPDRESSISDFLDGTDCEIRFSSYEDLSNKLRDTSFVRTRQQNTLLHRHKFSMQYELEHNVLPFMKTFT